MKFSIPVYDRYLKVISSVDIKCPVSIKFINTPNRYVFEKCIKKRWGVLCKSVGFVKILIVSPVNAGSLAHFITLQKANATNDGCAIIISNETTEAIM